MLRKECSLQFCFETLFRAKWNSIFVTKKTLCQRTTNFIWQQRRRIIFVLEKQMLLLVSFVVSQQTVWGHSCDINSLNRFQSKAQWWHHACMYRSMDAARKHVSLCQMNTGRQIFSTISMVIYSEAVSQDNSVLEGLHHMFLFETEEKMSPAPTIWPWLWLWLFMLLPSLHPVSGKNDLFVVGDSLEDICWGSIWWRCPE